MGEHVERHDAYEISYWNNGVAANAGTATEAIVTVAGAHWPEFKFKRDVAGLEAQNRLISALSRAFLRGKRAKAAELRVVINEGVQ